MSQHAEKKSLRAFRSRQFLSWSKREGLSDEILVQTIEEIWHGLAGKSLGGNIYKKRVRLPGRGKQGGARTIIAYKISEKVFFLYGFAKHERENITSKELKALKLYAAELLNYSDKQIDRLVQLGALSEIPIKKVIDGNA